MTTDFNRAEMLKAVAALASFNYEEAYRLLVPLAEAGNPKAQCNLATLYHLGLGVQMDGGKAVELYQQVAHLNLQTEHLSAIAWNNLATIYFAGMPGIDRNDRLAREYLRRARELGFEM